MKVLLPKAGGSHAGARGEESSQQESGRVHAGVRHWNQASAFAIATSRDGRWDVACRRSHGCAMKIATLLELHRDQDRDAR